MSTRSRASTTDVAVAERPAESRRRADRARSVTFVPAPEPAPEQQPSAEAPRLNYGLESVATSAPATAEDQVAEPFQPPAAPESGISVEQVAEREEQLAAAQAALEGASDTPSLMNAFADAPPTLKAQVSGELGSRMDTTLGQDSATIQQETPEIQASMQGNVPVPAGSISVPASDVTLEASSPATPAAEAVVGAPVQTEAEYQANSTLVSQLTRSFNAEGGAEDVGRALDSVQTTDPSIVTSPGSAPPIPLEGETDPQRMQSQIESGSQQAQTTLLDQQAQTQALPGTERVQLADVHETYALGELPEVSAEDAPAPDGAQQYLALNQPPELQTAFDQVTGASMQQSMTEARTQIESAAQERDQAHQQEVDTAQRDTATAQQQAESDQRTAVADSRREIETQRQATLEQQHSAVADVEQQAADRSQIDREAFDDRVLTDQQQLDERYQQAETDAETEVQRGEHDAEAERQRAERESEEQSWWEAALDFITDLFDALVGLINDIFDAVRAAVNALLDAVRDFALALIDLAADFLKGLISAFGDFLKGLVQGLLGELFPELARALTELIDAAVTLANSAIDAVANTLKSAVNAIVEALRAGIMALINAYQAAVNTALALARAALSGDWSAFIMQLIEAACRVAGLDPNQVFAFLGRTQETIQLIVDNPGQFFSNMLDSMVGGVQRFADHFVTHLQTGIIGWLTGTLGGAGITMPEHFDLMGVISLVTQILGLTWENLRIRIVRLIGERGVQVLEFVASYIQTLIEGGLGALWERIQNDLTTLRDIVFEQIRNYIVERIVVNAIRLLATMWEPVGWLVNFLIAAYQFYTFIRDQLQRIMQLVTTVVEAIGNIARGVLGPAQERVEGFLAGLLPLAIDLLARLLGLGNIGGRVREILTSVQEVIWRAIDGLIERVVGLFRGGAGTPGATDATGAPVAAGADTAGQIGERITVPTAQGEHHLYITRTENGANPIIESAPMTIGARLSSWRISNLPTLSNERSGRERESPQEKGTRLLNEADGHLTTLDSHADAVARAAVQNAGAGAASGGPAAAPSTAAPVASGGVPTQAQITSDERSLAGVLSQLFNLFGAADPDTGTLATRYQSQVAMAHPRVQQAITESLEALDRKAQEDGVDPTRRYTNWQQAQAGFNDERHVAGRPGGAAFRTLLEQPFNLQSSTYTQEFGQYVQSTLLVGALDQAIVAARAGGATPATYAGLANWDRGPTATFINSQKGDMNVGSGLYPRSRGQIIAMIFNASMERPAAATFLDELVAAGLNASSSPFHPMLSQQHVVDLVVAAANRLNNDETFVAAFAAAGRTLTATKTAGTLNAGDQLTLAGIRGAALAADTAIFTQAIYNAFNASTNFIHAATASGMTTANIRAAAAALASMIMDHIKSRPLFFVRPTDIPRDVPQNVPYVRVRQATTGSIAVAPALYGNLAAEIVTFLNLSTTQIHHVLPLYLGGGHELENLAVIFGGSSAAGTPHQMLHAVIDSIDISSYVATSAPRLTLRVEDLARHYREFNILIGILRSDGQIEWDDTGQRLEMA